MRNFHVFDSIIDFEKANNAEIMNFLSIIRFVETLDAQIAKDSSQHVVYAVRKGSRALKNASFLLGAYMILKLDCSTTDVKNCFAELESNGYISCANATFARPDNELKLSDCWDGLKRARELGWIAIPSHEPQTWGMINKEIYERNKNADLHEVIPQKFIAFKGPKDLGGNKFLHNFLRGTRDLSPIFYVEVFRKLGVSTVVRLAGSQYDPKTFQVKGITHTDLDFESAHLPPAAVVGAFFRAVDGAKGLAAVHCKPDLGRTTTLIALYLMRSLAFAPGEAVGWLRIACPAALTPDQLHFLRRVEAEFRHMSLAILHAPTHHPTPSPAPPAFEMPTHSLDWRSLHPYMPDQRGPDTDTTRNCASSEGGCARPAARHGRGGRILGPRGWVADAHGSGRGGGPSRCARALLCVTRGGGQPPAALSVSLPGSPTAALCAVSLSPPAPKTAPARHCQAPGSASAAAAAAALGCAAATPRCARAGAGKTATDPCRPTRRPVGQAERPVHWTRGKGRPGTAY